MTKTTDDLSELEKKTHIGAMGLQTATREIWQIDHSDFEHRKIEMADQLWEAAVDVGCFQIINHGIDLVEVHRASAMTEQFFTLPDSAKAQYPLCKALNVVWQSRAQVRPSADTPDQRASYQITRRHMESLWPTEAELVDFQQTIQVFEGRCWHVAMQVLSCFAQKLNFAVGFFTRAHDPARPSYQSTLRRPHYFATPPEQQANHGLWRRGPHTDFDSLTLFFSARARAACRCALARK